jgi:hypothetical protein
LGSVFGVAASGGRADVFTLGPSEYARYGKRSDLPDNAGLSADIELIPGIVGPTGDLGDSFKTGFEERESYQVSGVINFSSSVFDEQGYAVAALSVPFIRRIEDHISPKDVRRHVQEASREISREVGGK